MTSIALLFGINYIGFGEESGELKGCVNDVRNMTNFLTHKAHFDVVEQYTDEDDPTSVTGRAIIDKLEKLTKMSQEGNVDRVWVHYSGHGGGIRDRNGDERDGQDECILPVDYRTGGVITDDMLSAIIRQFHERTIVTMVFDCCHSGTIADLAYTYSGSKISVNNFAARCGADVCVISGCMDDQTAADAFNVRGRGVFSGAMSSCLLEAMASENNILKCIVLLRQKLASKKYTQHAVISSSRQIDSERALY